LESAFLIARGETLWMDLSKYETNQSTYTSFLTFTWAMIADLDIDSEVIRCLGDIRLDIWAVMCVARGRTYRGRLSYLPPPTALKNGDSRPTAIDMPRLTEPVPTSWTVFEDDIYLLWASQVSHAAEGSYHSPPSHMQDGVFQIMLLRAGNRNVGRLSIATVLLSLASGSHATHPAVEFVECVAYRLEPLVEGSYNDLDGEVIESGPVQAQVMPHALQVFGHIPTATRGV
jgi:sphingosine kinase